MNSPFLIGMEDFKRSVLPIRFGIFEVDLRAGELRRQGLKVKLQEQPFPNFGDAAGVSRRGGNAGRGPEKALAGEYIRRFRAGSEPGDEPLREAVGDSADSPRFVEDVTRPRLPLYCSGRAAPHPYQRHTR